MEFGGHTVNNISHNINKYDSAQRERIVPFPIPGETIKIPVPAIVDTMAILRAYFEENIYDQSLGDSQLSANLSCVVSKNKLKSLDFKYKILRPTAIIQEEKEKIKVFAGLAIGASKTGLTAFGPEVSILDKKDHLIGFNYNLIDNSVNASLAWKIKLHK